MQNETETREDECGSVEPSRSELPEMPSNAEFLSPLTIDEQSDTLGPCASQDGKRCSEKGFLAMSIEDYLELLDWSARQIVPGKRGGKSQAYPPVLMRLGLDRDS